MPDTASGGIDLGGGAGGQGMALTLLLISVLAFLVLIAGTVGTWRRSRWGRRPRLERAWSTGPYR